MRLLKYFILIPLMTCNGMSLTSKEAYCYTDPFACIASMSPMMAFSNVHNQLGCSERCLQFEECNK